ncbi:ABC transporter permease [Pseudomarimonas arenosa]|uniref:ABC transporter permease n=1 Tax=Pseudomarimonas arenosa TaxID=2774145 RepID=A0AAW3ZDY8_9GAMM|nr:ABC transporter permease [Pseudomarimonas arenosa]MBD8524475.1 ABC transporter permease [Pseudomarimonas arenosa]
MNKILQVARREFVATVMTKAFLFGLLIVPAMMVLMIWLLPFLINQKAPPIEGEIALLDRSGVVAEAAKQHLSPEGFASRRRDFEARFDAAMPGGVRKVVDSDLARSKIDEGLAQVLGEVPKLRVHVLADDAALEAAKEQLRQSERQKDSKLLAIIEIEADAVDAEAAALGSYLLYVRDKLDVRLLDELRDGMKQALVASRLGARQLDPAEVRRLTSVPRVAPIKLSAQGDSKRNEIASALLPMAFMVLMFIAVMTAGQQLMTSTIEEKASRVVELLLAAVSPTELMAGKILGQLAVGALMLALYGAIGLLGLISFAAMGLLDLSLLFYLFVFFLIAYVTLASLMAAIGAAVNELREAQTLLTPVILTMVFPMMLWMPISRDPNSMLAMVTSILPPTGPFVMIIRMSSSSPPPMWEVWLSIGLGILGAWLAVWFAGKVFRIGLLMHGKPPSFMTLLRWARMA